MIGDFLAPDHLAGGLVQGHQLGVECAKKHQVAIQRDTTVDHVAARTDVIGQTCIVLPQLLASASIYREHPRVGAGHVHHAVFDQRLRFLAALFFTTEGEGPDRAQILDVVAIDDVQRAVALALNAKTVGNDLLRVLGIVENILIGHGCQGAT